MKEGTNYHTGDSVWQVLRPADHSHFKRGRVVCNSQEGRKNLEEGRTQGAKEGAEKGKFIG